MRDSRKETGSLAEKLAETYLSKKGYKIIHRNYRTPLGEVDLIAKKNEFLIFIEVKSRSSQNFDPLDSITAKKQKKLIQLANQYLAKLPTPCPVVFDVVCVTESGDGNSSIEHIENAFSLI
jgi:putative endonuclease